MSCHSLLRQAMSALGFFAHLGQALRLPAADPLLGQTLILIEMHEPVATDPDRIYRNLKEWRFCYYTVT